MLNKNLLLLICCFLALAAKSQETKTIDENHPEIIKPILLDKAVLSGIDLAPVTDPKQPNRKLFQKRLYRGKDISVYVVSSETATAEQQSLGIDEFIYLFNGRARMKPFTGEEQYFSTGDFFVAPKGYAGEWETQGATKYHYELSVITTGRSKAEIDPNNILPIRLDRAKLSGIGITPMEGTSERYSDLLFEGNELAVSVEAEAAGSVAIETPLAEQMIYVLSGSLRLTPTGGETQTFYAGDFLVLPESFVGKWESDGHHLFRSLRVRKAG